MRKLLILTLFIISSCVAKAQEILPSELFQVYRCWRMTTPDFEKGTYEYVRTIDNHWQLRLAPQKDADGLMLLLAYEKNKAWYKDDQHGLMLVDNYKEKSSRSLVYTFTDADNWKKYQRQMQIMEAEVIDTGQKDGGTSTSYTVSDIFITLKEFPPGMNGNERQYQVQLFQR